MKSIDKHSLRKVDCEIYWMVSKYIVQQQVYFKLNIAYKACARN